VGADKAIKEGYDTRQIDEVIVFNLAATRPDLLTGPGGAPYGSTGNNINCAVIGFTRKAPTANLADPVPTRGSAAQQPRGVGVFVHGSHDMALRNTNTGRSVTQAPAQLGPGSANPSTSYRSLPSAEMKGL
jgi:hypothetical protein